MNINRDHWLIFSPTSKRPDAALKTTPLVFPWQSPPPKETYELFHTFSQSIYFSLSIHSLRFRSTQNAINRSEDIDSKPDISLSLLSNLRLQQLLASAPSIPTFILQLQQSITDPSNIGNAYTSLTHYFRKRTQQCEPLFGLGLVDRSYQREREKECKTLTSNAFSLPDKVRYIFTHSQQKDLANVSPKRYNSFHSLGRRSQVPPGSRSLTQDSRMTLIQMTCDRDHDL